MTLIGIRGDAGFVNPKLLLYAVQNSPCLVIDCANAANPHAIFPLYPDEAALCRVQVIQVELIYTFRDVLKQLYETGDFQNTKKIVITTFHHLFNYGNEKENREIYRHAWELMAKLGETCEVLVGVAKPHEEQAKKYCEVLETSTS